MGAEQVNLSCGTSPRPERTLVRMNYSGLEELWESWWDRGLQAAPALLPAPAADGSVQPGGKCFVLRSMGIRGLESN